MFGKRRFFMIEFDKLSLRDSSPYPEVMAARENKRLAAQISALYAGQNSELTSVAGYTYNSFVLSESYGEYADVFRKMAAVEMHHLSLLGQLMIKLGGDPVFGDVSGSPQSPVYWQGSNVSDERRPLNVFYGALRGEQAAYNGYISLARRCGDRYVFALLTRIALDEMLHAAAIKAMIVNYQRA